MSKPTCTDARKGKGYWDADGDACCAACDRLLDDVPCDVCGGLGFIAALSSQCRECEGYGHLGYCANPNCGNGVVREILSEKPKLDQRELREIDP